MTHKRLYAGLAVAVLVIAVAIGWVVVSTSPQYALVKLMDAAGTNDTNRFNQSNQANPTHQSSSKTANSSSDQNNQAISYFRQNYYHPLNLWQAYRQVKIQHETEGTGVLAYIHDGQKEIVFRLIPQNNSWQVTDEAKLNRAIPGT